jgi:hypothetical protein
MVAYRALQKNDSIFHFDVRPLTDTSLERLGELRTILWMNALEKLAERWGSLFGIEAIKA